MRGAEKLLEKAKRELGKEKPDYPALLKAVKEIRELVGKILREEQSEHESAERLRQRAVSALRDAERAISKAKEYVEDHRSYAGKSAKSYLEDAEDYFERSKKAQKLNDRISYAEEAKSKAEDAYTSAKKKVSERQSTSEYGYGRRGDSNVVIINQQESHYGSGYGSGGYDSGGGGGGGWSSDSGGGGGGGWSSDSGGGGGGDIGGGSDSGGGGGGGDI